MKVNTEKFDSLISEKESKWHHYEANSIWRKKATEISLQILSHLRSNNISQTEVAEKLGVTRQYISKILQGKENLGLSTICNLENALGIKLIEVPKLYNDTCYKVNTMTIDPIEEPVSFKSKIYYNPKFEFYKITA